MFVELTQDTMQICLNGHVITDCFHTDKSSRKNNCRSCGKETITKCLNCEAEIPGREFSRYKRLMGAGFPIYPTAPPFCESCGSSFPWTNIKKEKQSETESEKPIEKLEEIFSKFHKVVIELKRRREGRATFPFNDEYDVQDFLRTLLVLFFGDVRPEEATPSLAGKSGRMDFLLIDEKIAIETKMMRENLTQKKLRDELLIDIATYKEHPHCNQLVIFIYDPKFQITNSKGFIKDLEKQSKEDLKVKVFINPI